MPIRWCHLSLSKSGSAFPRGNFLYFFLLTMLRLQDKSSTYAGPIDVVKKIIKNDGLLGMYAGMEATFWR